MSEELRNIVRIDIEETDERPGTYGWQVRMRRQGQRRTKFFSDKKYGGRDEALEVAMAYRDMIEKDMPEPASPVKASKEARSKSGVPGLSVTERERGGRTKAYVQLNWLDSKGNRHTKAFSIEKWGLRRALWNACAKLAMHTKRDANQLFNKAYKNLQHYE